MASVILPGQRKNRSSDDNALGSFLPLATTVLGGAVGGPVGGAVGGMAGRAISEAITPADSQPNTTFSVAAGAVPASAMGRRMSNIQQDPYIQLSQANKALQYAPKDIQAQYQKPIEEALTIAQKARVSGGMV